MVTNILKYLNDILTYVSLQNLQMLAGFFLRLLQKMNLFWIAKQNVIMAVNNM